MAERVRDADVSKTPRAGALARLGRWCARNSWPVILIWLAVLAGATITNQYFGGVYSDDFTLSDSESGEGSAVLSDHGLGGASNSSRIVFTVDSGTWPATARPSSRR